MPGPRTADLHEAPLARGETVAAHGDVGVGLTGSPVTQRSTGTRPVARASGTSAGQRLLDRLGADEERERPPG